MRKLTLLALIGSSIFGQTLSLSSESAKQGQSVVLTLTFDSQGNSLPASLQWVLNFPSAYIIEVSPLPGPAALAANKTLVPCGIGPSSNLICLTLGINTNMISSGVVATIVFKLAPVINDQIIPIIVSSTIGALPDGTALPIQTIPGATITVLPTVLPNPCSPYGLTRTPVGPVLVYRNGLLQNSPEDYTTANPPGSFKPIITPVNWSDTDTAAAIYTRATPLSFVFSGQTISYWGYTLYRESWNCSTGKLLAAPRPVIK